MTRETRTNGGSWHDHELPLAFCLAPRYTQLRQPCLPSCPVPWYCRRRARVRGSWPQAVGRMGMRRLPSVLSPSALLLSPLGLPTCLPGSWSSCRGCLQRAPHSLTHICASSCLEWTSARRRRRSGETAVLVATSGPCGGQHSANPTGAWASGGDHGTSPHLRAHSG